MPKSDEDSVQTNHVALDPTDNSESPKAAPPVSEDSKEAISSALGQPAMPVPPRPAHEQQASPPTIANVLNITTSSLFGRGEGPIINLPYFSENDIHIDLDGRLDEAIWGQVPGHDDMLVIDPDTLRTPRYETRAHYLYTNKGMYIGVQMEQPPDTLIARLSSRDSFINRDSFGITLDTSGEGLYGYWFVVNLGGSVMDGTVLPERQFQNEWDGPWRRATAELPDGWSAEMFLPWSMMAMPQSTGPREFGFWSNRKVAHIDQRNNWVEDGSA